MSRAPSIFPSGSCGTGSTNCRATRRLMSSAARGQRSYYATRVLLQNGFEVKNISGGMLSRTYASFFLQEGPLE